MIVALFVLALAMLVGGVASIVQGAPFVRLEMGWTMVIAGSVVMSGGAVLAGVAAAVWRLRRIELELVETRETAGRMPAMTYPMPLPPGAGLPPGVALPHASTDGVPVLGSGGRREPGLAPVPDAAFRDGAPQGAAALAPDERAVLAAADLMPALSARRDAEPELADLADPIPPARRGGPETADIPPPGHHAPEPSVPEALVSEALAPEALAPEPAAREDVVPPEPPAPPNPPAEAEGPAAPEEAEPPPRVVAGTYASGGNTYVMYSDGSIEAETPGGKYTFTSLEELKVFASKENEGAPAAQG